MKFWYLLEHKVSVTPAIDPAGKGQTCFIDLQFLQIIFKTHTNFNLVSIMLTKFPYSFSFPVWITYAVNCKNCTIVFLTIGLPKDLYTWRSSSLDCRFSMPNCYYMQLVTIRCSIDYKVTQTSPAFKYSFSFFSSCYLPPKHNGCLNK